MAKTKKSIKKTKAAWLFLSPWRRWKLLNTTWRWLVIGAFVLIGAASVFTLRTLLTAVCTDVLSDVVVFAKVPGPPPTQAATIDSPTEGEVFDTQNASVSGTCQTNTYINIQRNGVSAGSTTCTIAGTYAITINLIVGSNTLVAQTIDFYEQYGPDSDPRIVTRLTPAIPEPPTPTPSPEPSPKPTPTPKPISVTEEPFIITSLSQAVRVGLNTDVNYRVKITGGKAPYTLAITWGDGKKSSESLKSAGELVLHHKYSRSGTYVINISGKDSNGTIANYRGTIAVATPSVANPPAGPAIKSGCSKQTESSTKFILRPIVLLPSGMIASVATALSLTKLRKLF